MAYQPVNQPYPILSAHEFVAQGTSAAAIASIARYNYEFNPALAARIRSVAEEVAAITGAKIYGQFGWRAPRLAANQNRPARKAARSPARRAAA